MSIFAS